MPKLRGILEILAATIALLCAGGLCSARGRDLDQLREDVWFLSDSLCAGRASATAGSFEASRFIYRRFESLGLKPSITHFKAGEKVCHNVSAEIKGKGSGLIVVVAYYDGLGTLGGTLRPGADANASGVAALLALADSLRSKTPASSILFAALDAHNASNAGAVELYRKLKGRRIKAAVGLEILGSGLAPVRDYHPRYAIILGGRPYKTLFETFKSPLVLSYDYYESKDFTELFHRKVSDVRPFLEAGIPSLVFTSGITYNTNQPTDTYDTLDYSLLADRIGLVLRWIKSQL